MWRQPYCVEIICATAILIHLSTSTLYPHSGQYRKLDYVQLNYKGPGSGSCSSSISSSSASGGLDDPAAGTYDLKWFDTVDGEIVNQTGVSVSSGDVTWTKPDSMGKELALYIKRLGD